MRSFYIVAVCLFGVLKISAQELYVSTEPASNMPAKSLGFRLNNYFMPRYKNSEAGISQTKTTYRLDPELMWGVHKNLMLHFNLFASNFHQDKFVFEGGSIYAKYRFLSLDRVHSHFRMAAYLKASAINNPIQYNDINLSGDNSGASTGIVATQLLHKIALSFTGGYNWAGNNLHDTFTSGRPQTAINYSFSAGYLMLPIRYQSFNQPNLNLYLEFLGKYNPETKEQYLDITPALQLILKSKIRIDIAYQRQITGNMLRINNQVLLVRFEYNLFNAYK